MSLSVGYGMVAMSPRQLDALAGSFSQVVEFCTSGLAASNRPDIENVRRMQRESSFHPLVRNNAPNGKGLTHPATFTRNHRARKDLDTGFGAFLDLAVHVNCIAYLKVRHRLLEALAFHRI